MPVGKVSPRQSPSDRYHEARRLGDLFVPLYRPRVGATGRCAGLQHVHSILPIESNAENGGESFSETLILTVCVILKILEEPGTIGKVLRFPT